MPGSGSAVVLSAAVLAAAALGCAAPRPAPQRVESVQGGEVKLAAEPAKGSAPPREGAALHCETVRPTGSNIPERVCRPIDDTGREREQARDWLVGPKSGSGRTGD